MTVDQFGRLALVASHQALIEAVLRCQRWRVVHQQADEREAGHVLAEHDEAHRQRRCHQQPERPPQPRPKRDGHEQHHLRHADRPGIQHRFEHEIREQLEDDEQGKDDQWTGPPLQGREADEDRRAGREHGPTYGMNRSAAPSVAQTNG